MMDLTIAKTNSIDPDFIALVKLLDEDLENRYGELQKQYNRHNTIDTINPVVMIYHQGTPAACGAFKEYDRHTVEIKRIFVKTQYRHQGIAGMLLRHLEELAASEGYRSAVLETGRKQPEAISLYQKAGYEIIQNYGPYAGDNNSVCMKKILSASK